MTSPWPARAYTLVAGGKGPVLEGGMRFPCIVQWPGKVPAGKVENQLMSGLDWFPTFVGAAGNPEIVSELKQGKALGEQTYKVHLDGYNQIPYLTGEAAESPRRAIVYFSDDGDLIAVRVEDWKFHLAVQRADTMRQWAEPFVKLRVPYIISLRRDPFERAEFTSNSYMAWLADHIPQM